MAKTVHLANGLDTCASSPAVTGAASSLPPVEGGVSVALPESTPPAISSEAQLVPVNRVDLLALAEPGAQVAGDRLEWLDFDAPTARAQQPASQLSTSPSKKRQAPGVQLIPASEVSIERIVWNWNQWLARSKLHILAGPPGAGKTTLAIEIAAITSCGGCWPDNSRAERGAVLIWSGEDGMADTLLPRLIAAGADLANVHFVNGICDGSRKRPFDPATDIRALEDEVEAMGNVALIIIDSIVSSVAGDSHRNAEVRRGLQPLVDLAANQSVAVLGITHLSKRSGGQSAAERVIGSVAFSALPRVVIMAMKGADGRRVMTRAKSNLGEDGGGFAYRVEPVDMDGVGTCRIVWEGALAGSADEIIAAMESEPGRAKERERAEAWLADVLRNGAVAASVVEERSKVDQIAWRTIERAKRALGVSSVKSAAGGWEWRMPETRSEDRQVRQSDGNGGVGGLQSEHVRSGGSIPAVEDATHHAPRAK
jgi:putative DNA primase/helicase